MKFFSNFLHRNFYKANPRPDALMKEQIVEMSGLSPRVIRVWFQNKRCKDKKMQIKQEMQQERVSYCATTTKLSPYFHCFHFVTNFLMNKWRLQRQRKSRVQKNYILHQKFIEQELLWRNIHNKFMIALYFGVNCESFIQKKVKNIFISFSE